MSQTILHVQLSEVDAPLDEEDLNNVRDAVNEGLEKWGLEDEYEAFITGPEVSIHDVPALDNYVEEVANRVADKLDEE